MNSSLNKMDVIFTSKACLRVICCLTRRACVIMLWSLYVQLIQALVLGLYEVIEPLFEYTIVYANILSLFLYKNTINILTSKVILICNFFFFMFRCKFALRDISLHFIRRNTFDVFLIRFYFLHDLAFELEFSNYKVQFLVRKR